MEQEQNKKGERILISFDYAIKQLLRNKANFEILEGFLSELLMRDISVKNIGESESNKEHATDKYNKVDILVEDDLGEIMLIELQFTPEIDYLHRMLYGTSKAITERMVRGAKYMEVKKVYSINIVYFDLGQGKDYVYHGKTRFMGLHKKNEELRLSDLQRETFEKEMASDIYPEYYILKVNNFNDVAQDTLDEWIYFLKNNSIKDEFKAKGMEKAREILDRNNLSPEEQKAYDYILSVRSEDLSAISTAKDTGMREGKIVGREEGRIEGRIEGREEGRKEGREEGREEGRIEREKLAKKLEKEREERERLEKEREKEREEREKEREILLAKLAKFERDK